MYYGGRMDSLRYVLIFLFFFPFASFADTYPASSYWQWYDGRISQWNLTHHDSASAACTAAASSYGWTGTVSGTNTCLVQNPNGSGSINVVLRSILNCPYGGTLSGGQCIDAPSCPDGQPRNAAGECLPPPPECPPQGEKKTIAVCNMNSQNTDSTMNLTIGGNSAKTAVYEQCNYTYTDGDFVPENGTTSSGCYIPQGTELVNGTYEVCCSYEATSVGTNSDSIETAKNPDAAKPDSAPVAATDDGKCVSDSKGNQVCSQDGTSGQSCGTVNGTKVCVDNTNPNAPPTIEGKTPTATETCTWSNGELKCVTTTDNPDPDASPTNEGCIVVNGKQYCINKDTKEITEETIVTDPDGTVRRVKTKTTNTIGDDDETIEETTNPDGSKTTTKSGGNGEGDGKTDCDKYPNAIGCQDITKGSVPAKDAIQTINVPASLDYTSWGSGSCPEDIPVNLSGGVNTGWSFQPACDFAEGLRPILVAIAFLIAGRIVLGGVKD
jgi:hypothetical protein